MPAQADLQNELTDLSRRLEDRQSIIHFAWCFGLSCVAFMASGVSLKLFHDSVRTPKFAFLLALIGAGCWISAGIRIFKGWAMYRTELRDYERLCAVRRELGLDVPRQPGA